MKNILTLVVLTFVSGLLSGLLGLTHSSSTFLKLLTYIGPGVLLGVALSILFFYKYKLPLKNYFIFTIISTIAYLVAYTSFMHLFSSFNGEETASCFWNSGTNCIDYLKVGIELLISGILGALILTLGTSYFIGKINHLQIFTTTLVGGLLGILFIANFWGINLAIPFIIWQMVIGIFLYTGIETHKRFQVLNT